jgi:hypothetical protein
VFSRVPRERYVSRPRQKRSRSYHCYTALDPFYEKLYCGARTSSGSHYCAAHAGQAFTRRPLVGPRQRNEPPGRSRATRRHVDSRRKPVKRSFAHASISQHGKLGPPPPRPRRPCRGGRADRGFIPPKPAEIFGYAGADAHHRDLAPCESGGQGWRQRAGCDEAAAPFDASLPVGHRGFGWSMMAAFSVRRIVRAMARRRRV